MSEAHAATDDHQAPGIYEIRIRGHLDGRWAERFDGLRFNHERDGTTILVGPVIDQAALHGLLRRVRDLGLPLVSVILVQPDDATNPDVADASERNGPRREIDA